MNIMIFDKLSLPNSVPIDHHYATTAPIAAFMDAILG